MTEIIIKTYDVLEALKQDEHYLAFKDAKARMESKYQQEIKAFQDAKAHYESIIDTGGSYHPDYTKSIQVLGVAKKNLYEKQDVMTYVDLEKVVEKKVNDLLRSIAHAISMRIQTPDEMGFLKKQGGGCGVH